MSKQEFDRWLNSNIDDFIARDYDILLALS
jgi:hypothetical protein